MGKPSQNWLLGYYAGYQKALDHARAALDLRKGYYHTSVFHEARAGEQYESPDAAAAAMARFTCEQASQDMMKLKNEKFAEIGSDLDFTRAANRFTWKTRMAEEKTE